MATARLDIDGRTVTAAAGSSLLHALLDAGHSLPHPCHHPALSAPASCRMCLVAELDDDGGHRLVTTCNRTVRDGLRLSLQVPELAAARRQLVDDLLLRHPAECHVCERAGECELQEAARAHGGCTTPAATPASAERIELGPRLQLDRRRCVLCTRCVRFAEVSGRQDLAVFGAGREAMVAAAGDAIDHPLAGNLVDLCPAGALVEPQERLAPPPWRLTGIASVCAGCASGCRIRVDVAAGGVQRVKPDGEGDDEQGFWLCDEGRYGWPAPEHRLRGPQLDGAEVEWDAACAAVAERMERGAAAVLLSPYLSNEEAFLLARLAERWEAELFLWSAQHEAGDRVFPSGFTIRAQRGPNAAGVAAVAAACQRPLGSEAELRRRLADGEVDALYVVGGAHEDHGPGLDTDGAAPGFLAVHDLRPGGLSEAAHVVLAGGSAWTEKEGTFIDGHGRLQRVRAAAAPPAGARSDFWILAALWHGGPNRDTPDQAFARLARSAGRGPFAGLDYGALESRARPARGVACGGGWLSLLQRRGLVPVEDHARRR